MSAGPDWTSPAQVKGAFRRFSGTGSEEQPPAKDIFAVDRQSWTQVCVLLGIDAAASYLVLARGTGRDNASTAWSANAIEKHVGIHHRIAAKQIDAMRRQGLIEQLRDGSRPRYKLVLPTTPDWIWLPNDVVTGTGIEISALKLLWQAQDVNALRLFVELYYWNHLPTDGGISRAIIRSVFERHELVQVGEYRVWSFSQRHWVAAGEPGFAAYFNLYSDHRLIEQSPHLCMGEQPEAGIIHPYGIGRGECIEDRIGLAAHSAGLAMVSEETRRLAEADGLWLAPVRRHIANVQMVGVARLRYLPDTGATNAWRHEVEEKGEVYISGYERLADRARYRDSDIKVRSR